MGCQTASIVNEKTEKQQEKEEQLQRRKEELEDELERYAQAGVVSPGLVKAARWFSRVLWMGMSALVVFLLYSGWGAVSEDKYNEAVQRAIDIKQTANETRTRLDEESGKRQVAEARLTLTELQLEDLLEGRSAAEAAERKAKMLVAHAWGELAYAEHWREKLKTADPGMHEDPVAGAASLIRQASRAPAAQEFGLLAETAEFGREAVTQAVDQLLTVAGLEHVASRLAIWLGGDDITQSVKAKLQEGAHVELEFAYSLLTHGAPLNDSKRAEGWIGYALRAYDAAQDELAECYQTAPEGRRLELLALLAETSDLKNAAVFKWVATSDRPEAEKILAVRWMGTRRDTESRGLLKTLSEGKGAVAEEARQALEKLED